MSWIALPTPEKTWAKANQPAVTLSASPKGRFVQSLYLVVRPDLELSWWQYGAAVTVELGENEHEGRLRIRAGGDRAISPPTGRNASKGKPNAPMLRVRGLPGLPQAGLKRQGVAWEILGDALIVTLPWSGKTAATKPEQRASDLALVEPPRPQPPQRPLSATAKAPFGPLSTTPVNSAMNAGGEVKAMRKLQQSGGFIRFFKDLSASDTRCLRSCAEKGWAEYTDQGKEWRLTVAGMRHLADLDAKA